MSNRSLLFVALISSVLFGGIADAHAEELVVSTDRPSVGASAHTVAPAKVQLEAGVDIGIDDSTAVTFPVALFRFGLTEMLELQIGAPSITFEDDGDSFGSTRLATKFAGAVSSKLSLGLLSALDLPNDEDGLFGLAEFSATGLADYAINDMFGVSLNLGLAMVGRDEPGFANRQIQQLSALALGVNLPAGLSAWVEFYELYQPSFSEVQLKVDGGIAWLAANWLQFDVYANAGFGDELADLVVGAGFGIVGP